MWVIQPGETESLRAASAAVCGLNKLGLRHGEAVPHEHSHVGARRVHGLLGGLGNRIAAGKATR